LEFGDVGFCGGRENWRTQRKTLRARQEPTTKSTHTWHWARIKSGLHWWEVSTLTTAPPCSSNWK